MLCLVKQNKYKFIFVFGKLKRNEKKSSKPGMLDIQKVRIFPKELWIYIKKKRKKIRSQHKEEIFDFGSCCQYRIKNKFTFKIIN